MRQDALPTGFRPALRILLIVSSESTSRGFTQFRLHLRDRIGDIGDMGPAFSGRIVAITAITIG
jgi:hypothetical protein